MPTITVKTSIGRHEPGGFGMWIRSTDPQQAWWEWYETELDAYIEEVMLGLATEQITGTQRLSATVRKTLKNEASIDPADLARFAFKAIE
jgi:hypothetical protein